MGNFSGACFSASLRRVVRNVRHLPTKSLICASVKRCAVAVGAWTVWRTTGCATILAVVGSVLIVGEYCDELLVQTVVGDEYWFGWLSRTILVGVDWMYVVFGDELILVDVGVNTNVV